VGLDCCGELSLLVGCHVPAANFRLRVWSFGILSVVEEMGRFFVCFVFAYATWCAIHWHRMAD